MDTKIKGDIAEQAAILEALKRGWNVLSPIGDRLPYDLVFEINKVFVRIQVKSAWFYENSQNYAVDTRRTKTNRRQMKREFYQKTDFDFALVYLQDLNVFYLFPVDIFVSYASEIHIVESQKRQRKPRSAKYREAWEFITQWAAQNESSV